MYSEIDPVDTTLEIRPEGQKRAATSMPNAIFAAGKVYSLIVMGTGPSLEVITVEDEIGTLNAQR